jgi:hypothetical protein
VTSSLEDEFDKPSFLRRLTKRHSDAKADKDEKDDDSDKKDAKNSGK